MKFKMMVAGFFCTFPLAAQQSPAPAPQLELMLRCSEVQTAQQSRAVKSSAYGFGNPTNPEDVEFPKSIDRVVLVELHGATGRIHLPRAVLAATPHPASEGWYPLEKVVATSDLITANLRLTATGQSVRIDRRTGTAQLFGYGQQPLRGNCRIDRKPQQF
jgi:hypothetical protein